MTEAEKQKIRKRADQAFYLVCQLADKGDKAFQMSIPPQPDDADVLLCEVIGNVKELLHYVAILESENKHAGAETDSNSLIGWGGDSKSAAVVSSI